MKKFILISTFILILTGLFFGAKIYGARGRWAAFATEDNVAFRDILGIVKSSPNISAAEYIEKLEANLRNRDQLIARVELSDFFLDTPKKDAFVQLLHLQNQYVRSQKYFLQALLKYESAEKRFIEARRRAEQALDRCRRREPDPTSISQFERYEADEVYKGFDDNKFWPGESQMIRREFEKEDGILLADAMAGLKIQIENSTGILQSIETSEGKYYPNFLPLRNLSDYVRNSHEFSTNVKATLQKDYKTYKIKEWQEAKDFEIREGKRSL